MACACGSAGRARRSWRGSSARQAGAARSTPPRARCAAPAAARLRSRRDRYAGLIRERYPDIPRRVSGYNLPALLPENGFHVARALVGSESTCVLVLEARTRLVPDPPARSLLVIGYPDVFAAGDHVVEPMRYGPIALEALDQRL